METKIIIYADLARHLLRNGFTVIDIKPRKDLENASLFIFEVGQGFYDVVNKWKRNHGEKENL